MLAQRCQSARAAALSGLRGHAPWPRAICYTAVSCVLRCVAAVCSPLESQNFDNGSRSHAPFPRTPSIALPCIPAKQAALSPLFVWCLSRLSWSCTQPCELHSPGALLQRSRKGKQPVRLLLAVVPLALPKGQSAHADRPQPANRPQPAPARRPAPDAQARDEGRERRRKALPAPAGVPDGAQRAQLVLAPPRLISGDLDLERSRRPLGVLSGPHAPRAGHKRFAGAQSARAEASSRPAAASASPCRRASPRPRAACGEARVKGRAASSPTHTRRRRSGQAATPDSTSKDRSWA